MNWQERARRLPFGGRKKVPHCGPEPSAYISNSPAGISLYCFRCGPDSKQFEPHGRLSAADILAYRKHDDSLQQGRTPSTVPLYDDSVESSARVWVLKAGITPERASDIYGMGWDGNSRRIVVPVLHNERETGLFTARATDDRKPKYIMPKGSIGASWYRLERDRGKNVVIVEDVLSAIRVYEAGFNVLAVLGTTIGTSHVGLLDRYTPIGWFDGDKAGRSGFVKLRRALSPYGVEPKRIETEKDPKRYSKGEIQQFVEEAMDGH